MEIMPTTFSDITDNNHFLKGGVSSIQLKQNNVSNLVVKKAVKGKVVEVSDSSKIGLVNATLLEEVLQNQADIMKVIQELQKKN